MENIGYSVLAPSFSQGMEDKFMGLFIYLLLLFFNFIEIVLHP